jgi:hypothetical protein
MIAVSGNVDLKSYAKINLLKTSEKGGLNNQARHLLSKPEFSGLQNFLRDVDQV